MPQGKKYTQKKDSMLMIENDIKPIKPMEPLKKAKVPPMKEMLKPLDDSKYKEKSPESKTYGKMSVAENPLDIFKKHRQEAKAEVARIRAPKQDNNPVKDAMMGKKVKGAYETTRRTDEEERYLRAKKENPNIDADRPEAKPTSMRTRKEITQEMQDNVRFYERNRKTSPNERDADGNPKPFTDLAAERFRVNRRNAELNNDPRLKKK